MNDWDVYAKKGLFFPSNVYTIVYMSFWRKEAFRLRFFEPDFESKIDSCKQKTEAVKLEVISDEELECLHKELEQEYRKESLLLEDIR